VAVEGIDGAGTTTVANLLARWIERRGRRVHVVPWDASKAVRRAAADGRARQALTPQVAALLVVAEAVRRSGELVGRPSESGDVVIADRYAWTAVAREVARGLDPAWVAGLYERLVAPVVVVLCRENPARAVERSIDGRLGPERAEAVTPAFSAFVGRLAAALDDLATGRTKGPWPVRSVVLDVGGSLDASLAPARDAIRAALDGGEGRAA
jgi:thymidylate kinase